MFSIKNFDLLKKIQIRKTIFKKQFFLLELYEKLLNFK